MNKPTMTSGPQTLEIGEKFIPEPEGPTAATSTSGLCLRPERSALHPTLRNSRYRERSHDWVSCPPILSAPSRRESLDDPKPRTWFLLESEPPRKVRMGPDSPPLFRHKRDARGSLWARCTGSMREPEAGPGPELRDPVPCSPGCPERGQTRKRGMPCRGSY